MLQLRSCSLRPLRRSVSTLLTPTTSSPSSCRVLRLSPRLSTFSSSSCIVRVFSSRPPDNRNSFDDKEDDYEKRTLQKSPRRGVVGGTLFAVSVLFGKTKYLLAALKVTKLAPLASMLISSAAYSMIFGWPYAVGMVGLIFVHECGHAVAMKHYNVPFSPMVFVPFMGAVIAMKDHPRNAYQDGVIGLAGPVAGTAAAVALGFAGQSLDSQLMLALADWGYIINLFNLMPVGSMDGGRVLSAVSPYFGIVGLAGGAACIYFDIIGNPIFYLIMLGGTYSSVQRIMGWDEKHLPPNYYNLTRSSQGKLFASYLALVGFLLTSMAYNNRRRKSPERIRREREGEYFVISDENDQWDDFHYESYWDDDDE